MRKTVTFFSTESAFPSSTSADTCLGDAGVHIVNVLPEIPVSDTPSAVEPLTTRVEQAPRLTDHFALIADAALAFVCESLHARENRIRIEMRFRDHVRFEAAASPAIVEVGRE